MPDKKAKKAQEALFAALLSFIFILFLFPGGVAKGEASFSMALSQMDISAPITVENLLFKNIRIDATVEVLFTQVAQETGSIRIEGRDKDYMKRLHIDIMDETLIIWAENDQKKNNSMNHNKDDIQVFVSNPLLNIIEVNGAGEFSAEQGIKQPEIEIVLSGASEADALLEVVTLKMTCQGASEFELMGTAQTALFTLQGASEGDADELIADAVTAKLEGAANLEVYAVNSLNVQIDGVGRLEYKGKPSLTQSVNGIGVITPKQ